MINVKKIFNVQKKSTYNNLGRKENFSLIFISIKIGAKEHPKLIKC